MGYFRFILAILVCCNHLWVLGGVGRYAVFSFYILSGYLMTTTVRDRYGTSLSGYKRYITNRILRIYPTYWIVFTFTVLAIFLIGEKYTSIIDPNLSVPSDFRGWFMNTTLLGLDFNVLSRTIPPSWTLFVELFFYFLIPLAVRLGKKFILLWLCLSTLYHLYFMIFPVSAGYSWNERYGDVFSGSLGFSIGCFTSYFFRTKSSTKFLLTISLIGLVASYSIPIYFMFNGYDSHDWNIIAVIGFYGSIFSSSVFIQSIVNTKPSPKSIFLGELSYPLYLVHLPIGFIVVNTLNYPPRSMEVLIVSIIASIIISILIKYLFEDRINKIRSHIRP